MAATRSAPHLTRETLSGRRPADGVVGCVYESFVPGEDCRGLGLRQGPLHLRLETISARNGPCPVPRKPSPESSVPGENLTGGSRRNQLRRGHGSPPVLSEVSHELSTAAHSKECKRSRSNSFRPDSPLTTTFNRGRKTQTNSPTTPDMVPSGRVLRASVKSPIYCTVNQMTLVHMVFSREVFSCAFCTKLPSYTEALRACLSRLKKRPGRLFSHLPGLLFLLKAVTCARSVQVIVII